MNPELDRKLRSLRLSGMALALPARNQEAIHHQLAYTDFLELLVEDELARRRDRLFSRRLKQAGLPEVKTLEEFDWTFNPQIPKALILDLATTRFVREHDGLLLLGPSGTGKTHPSTYNYQYGSIQPRDHQGSRPDAPPLRAPPASDICHYHSRATPRLPRPTGNWCGTHYPH